MLYCTFYKPTYNIIKQKSQTVHVLQFILHTYTQAVSRRRVYKKKRVQKTRKHTTYLQKQSSFKQVIQLAVVVNMVHCTSIHPYYIYLFLSVSITYVFISITKQQYPTPPKYYYYIILQVHSHCRIIFSLWCICTRLYTRTASKTANTQCNCFLCAIVYRTDIYNKA